MKLFVFFAAAVLAQQNVCSADCEQTHVDVLIQFNHDQACINAAGDDFYHDLNEILKNAQWWWLRRDEAELIYNFQWV